MVKHQTLVPLNPNVKNSSFPRPILQIENSITDCKKPKHGGLRRLQIENRNLLVPAGNHPGKRGLPRLRGEFRAGLRSGVADCKALAPKKRNSWGEETRQHCSGDLCKSAHAGQ